MKVDAEQLLKEAHALAEQKRRRASKLTPYRDFIINTVKEGIPLNHGPRNPQNPMSA